MKVADVIKDADDDVLRFLMEKYIAELQTSGLTEAIDPPEDVDEFVERHADKGHLMDAAMLENFKDYIRD